MNSFTKKALSVFLAVILASAAMTVVSALPVDNPEEFSWFYADIDYKTNQLYSLYLGVNFYSVCNEEVFDCTVLDSAGNPVLERAMYDVEVFPTILDGFAKAMAEDFVVPGDEYIALALNVNATVILNPDELYTVKVAVGSFSNAQGDDSPEFMKEFYPSDYIYVPTVWDRILGFLNSNFIFRIIFAPLIVIIEYLYYAISGGPDMPFVLS